MVRRLVACALVFFAAACVAAITTRPALADTRVALDAPPPEAPRSPTAPPEQSTALPPAKPAEARPEDIRYLKVVWGMILRQKHNPPSVRAQHLYGNASVDFFLDDKGHLVRLVLYRTSGYVDMDAEALAAVKRAAPFPPPPQGKRPHLVATMEFKE
jgi:TonB family protein